MNTYRILDTGSTRLNHVGFRLPDNSIIVSAVPEDYVTVTLVEYNRLLSDRNAAKQQMALSPEEARERARRAFHAQGTKTYDNEWDDARPSIVRAVTHGRTSSSKGLTTEEYVQAIKVMEVIDA